MDCKPLIRPVPDFPKPGITFWDITPLLRDADALHHCIQMVVERYENAGAGITKIVAPESRGFILGTPVAWGLRAGFVPIRKPGKLPHRTVYEEYALEYGTNTVEMHADAIEPGDRVLFIDDVLATGGTAQACINLVEKQGGTVVGLCFLLELLYLDGRKAFLDRDIFSLISLSKQDLAPAP